MLYEGPAMREKMRIMKPDKMLDTSVLGLGTEIIFDKYTQYSL